MSAHSFTRLAAVSLLIAGCEGNSASAPNARDAASPSTLMAASLEGAGSQADSAAVAAVSAAWDAAWNAGNGAGIGALFVDDGEIVNGRGQVVSGSAMIRLNHIAAFAGVFHGTHSKGTIRRVTLLSGTTAVLDVDNVVTGFTSLPGGGIPTQPGLNFQRHKRVLVKRAGQWRVLQMQFTTVVAGAAPVPPQ